MADNRAVRGAWGGAGRRAGAPALRPPARSGAPRRAAWTGVAAAALVLAAGAVAAAPAGPPAGQPSPVPGPGLRLEVLGGPLLPGEPAALRVTWRGLPPEAAPAEGGVLAVTVARPGSVAAPRALWLDLVVVLAADPPAPGAGGTGSRTFLIALARTGEDRRAPVEFLFPAAGEYLVGPAGGGEPAAVTVRPPTAPQDRAAARLWTLEAAGALAGDTAVLGAALPVLRQAASECPASRFAPYALWAEMRRLSQRAADRADQVAVARLGEAIIDRHAASPLVEVVFDGVVEAYRAAEKGDLARDAAEDLARARPGSGCVARLRAAYGDAFGRLSPRSPWPPPGPAVQGTARVAGLDRVPDGPRQALEKYLRAVAEGRYEAMRDLAARDFMGDYGPRARAAASLAERAAGAGIITLEATVAGAASAAAYTRPASLPFGEERAWHGSLCVVEGSLTLRWMGGAANGLDAPKACWVLLGYPDGRWRLVSESASSRNLASGQSAQRLFYSLRRTFTTLRISDGQRERFPYEEVKVQAGVAGRVDDARTEWRSHNIIMGGANLDEVRLDGRVRMAVRGQGDEAPTWVQKDVTLWLVPQGDGALMLRQMDVREAAPAP